MHTGRTARCAGRASAAWWSFIRWWGGPTPPGRLPASWRQLHSHANRYQMNADCGYGCGYGCGYISVLELIQTGSGQLKRGI